MLVAVASSDGIVINQHFGHTNRFYIFEFDPDTKSLKYLGLRRCNPFCHGGEHEDRDLEDAVEEISDCSEVFALRIGSGAGEALYGRNIKPINSKGIITDVLAEHFGLKGSEV